MPAAPQPSHATNVPYKALNTSSILSKYRWLIVPSYLAIGTASYHAIEGWTIVDALYFCCVCLTTVGYGDLAPTSPGSKAFTVVFVLVGLSLVATSLGHILSKLQEKLAYSARVSSSSFSTPVQLAGSVASLLLLLTTGAAFVHGMEHWSWGDSFYWAVLTCTTIGFGDFSPTQWQDRLFAVFYLLLAVGLFVHALGQFAAILMELEARRAIDAFVRRGVSAELIREMDADGSGEVDKLEFVRHMLIRTGKLRKNDFDEVLALFDSLDADGNGTIGPEDAARTHMTAQTGNVDSAPMEPATPAWGTSQDMDRADGASLTKPLMRQAA